MKAGKETELYNQGYMDGFDDAQKAHIEPIKPKIKDVKEKSFPNDDPDYWTRLEHTYAGMAMQGLMTILPNIGGLEGRTPKDEIVDIATETAHALIQKLKEKEEME